VPAENACGPCVPERAPSPAAWARRSDSWAHTTCGGCQGGNVEYAPAETKKNGTEVVHLATGMVVGYAPLRQVERVHGVSPGQVRPGSDRRHPSDPAGLLPDAREPGNMAFGAMAATHQAYADGRGDTEGVRVTPRRQWRRSVAVQIAFLEVPTKIAPPPSFGHHAQRLFSGHNHGPGEPGNRGVLECKGQKRC
jgi:hypothetical protein